MGIAVLILPGEIRGGDRLRLLLRSFGLAAVCRAAFALCFLLLVLLFGA